MADCSWRVRAATVADAPALALVGAATFLETFAGVLAGEAIVAHCAVAHTPQVYVDYLAADARVWLAELDPGAAPVGLALLTTADLPGAQAGDLELKRIYALSRFHGSGSGIGAALMAAVLDAASDARRLLLGVYAGNARAQAFYRKQGFAPVGERRFDVGGTLYDDIVFARAIAA